MPPPRKSEIFMPPILMPPQKSLCHPVYATPWDGIKKKGGGGGGIKKKTNAPPLDRNVMFNMYILEGEHFTIG